MLTGVSACIFDQAGRVLLAHHVDSGIWALPGGAVEPDEDPAAAVAREAREELGIAVALQGLIGVYGGPESRVSYPNGDVVSYVAIVYACTAAETAAALDTSEVDKVRFVAHLDGLLAARWLPSVHADAVRCGSSDPLPHPALAVSGSGDARDEAFELVDHGMAEMLGDHRRVHGLAVADAHLPRDRGRP